MGYIGIPQDLLEVGKFIEERELCEAHIKYGYCYYHPIDKREGRGGKEFSFYFFGSNHYRYTYIDDEGKYKTIKTDPTQFIKYANKGDNFATYELLNYSLYCNQEDVMVWAQKCIDNYVIESNMKMTQEQAYKLADVVGFYNSPVWETYKEKPWYYDFYTWKKGWLNSNTETGNIKYELFNTTELKAAYVKGIIDRHKTFDKIMIANALDQVDKCAEFISDVCYKNGIFDSVKEVTRRYGYPICSTLILSDEAAKFFKNYQIPSEWDQNAKWLLGAIH